MDTLTNNSNVPANKQHIINFKNEFLYDRIMLTSNKKQYIGKLISQEGNMLPKPKVDMKGLSIKKVNVNIATRKYFTDIIEKEVLFSPKVDLVHILSRFKEFENMIRESLLRGETTFSTPARLNDIESYKTPYRIGPVRGAIIYNYLYPENTIRPPAKVNTFKILGSTLEDLRCIQGTEYFEVIKKEIFSSSTLIKPKESSSEEKKKTKEQKAYEEKTELAKYGFNIIALPKDIKVVPDWLLPLIDVDTIVEDNLRNGNIILESLGVKIMTLLENKDYYTNVIDF
jgi:hypothetical protein